MRKTLIQIHLYLGLASAFYLIIFGISSINLNHRFSWMAQQNTQKSWEAQVKYPSKFTDKQLVAEAIRDSLGLMGWAPYWDHQMQDEVFKFKVVHYGKEYAITAHKETALVEVIEYSKGFWWTFNSLHFLGESIPAANWLVNSWQYYQLLTVIIVMFSVISGVYFWSKRKHERRIGLILISAFSGFSIFLILYIWLVG